MKMMSKAIQIIIIREFHRIAERKTLYLLVIILPIIIFLFYPLIYTQELLREIPVVIYDADHSSLSQKIIEMVESAPSMKIVKYVSSVKEIKNNFLNGNISGAFYFPSGMENEIKAGKNSTVVVYRNTSNLIIGNMLMKDGSTIIRTASAGILLKKMTAKGMMTDKAMDIINPIKIETQSLYNPNYSYLNYLVPGILAFTFQMIIMIASVLVLSSEFTHETFPELLEIANNNLSLILLGKAVPHFIIHSSTAIFIVGVIFPFFGIKVIGSILILILFFFLFILACLMLGLLISSIFHDQLFATELAVFINTPAFIFSGFTFPLWGMPFTHSVIAQILPFTHFLSGFLKIYQMNSPLIYILPEVLVLLLFVFVSSILTHLILKHQVNKYYKSGITSKLVQA